MCENNEIKIVAFQGELWIGGLLDFVVWIKDKVNLVPEEFRKDSKIEFTGISEGGNSEVEIWYLRPQTQGEKSEKEAGKIRMQVIREQNELEELERLKEKYKNHGKPILI